MEIRQAIIKVLEKKNLTVAEAEAAINSVMKGEVSEILLSSF